MRLIVDEIDKSKSKEQELEQDALTFSGGEERVLLGNIGRIDSIAVRHPTSANMFRLAMVVDIFRMRHCELPPLLIPYFPGARQDRPDGSALSARVYADFVNSLEFPKVTIYDAHSDVTPALIKKCSNRPHVGWFPKALNQLNHAGPKLYLFPDSGAAKKYYNQYKITPHPSNIGGDIEFCTKTRDPATGKLSNFQVPDLRRYKEHFIWIIDDICDGGGTFTAIAEKIHEQFRPAFLGLAVTHAIFSKGIGDLQMYFDAMAFTDSITDKRKWYAVNDFEASRLIQVEVINEQQPVTESGLLQNWTH